MDWLSPAIGNIFEIKNLLFLLTGVSGGILVGALPGLTGTMAIALLVPFTYGLSPETALIMLGGVYVGAMYGGSISAILINTPGAPASIATTFDGYPMAMNGRAEEALVASAVSSGIGGLLGTMALLFFSPILAKVSLRFGPPEYFWLGILGLAIIASLSAKSLAKELFGGLLSYQEAVRASNDQDSFGKGNIEGVIASKTAKSPTSETAPPAKKAQDALSHYSSNVCLGISGLVIFAVTLLNLTGVDLQSAILPKVCATLMAIVSIGLLIKAWTLGRQKTVAIKTADKTWKPGTVLITILITLSYVGLMGIFGFFSTSFCVLVALGLLLAPKTSTKSKLPKILLSATLTCAAFYGVFVKLFNVPFPTGILF